MQKDCLKRETFSKRMYYTEKECPDTERNWKKTVPTSRLDKGHRSRPFLWKHWLMWGPVTCYNHRFVPSETFPTFLICLRDGKREETVCLGPRVREFHFAFSTKWWIKRMWVVVQMLTEWFPGKAAPVAHITQLFILMRRGIYIVS